MQNLRRVLASHQMDHEGGTPGTGVPQGFHNSRLMGSAKSVLCSSPRVHSQLSGLWHWEVRKLPRYFSGGSILGFFSSCLSCWGSAGNRSPQPLKRRWRTPETCFAPLPCVSKVRNRHKPKLAMQRINTAATQCWSIAPTQSLQRRRFHHCHWNYPFYWEVLSPPYTKIHLWNFKLHLHHKRTDNQAHMMKILNWGGIVPQRGYIFRIRKNNWAH